MRTIVISIVLFLGFCGSVYAGNCNTFSLDLSTDQPTCSEAKYKLYVNPLYGEKKFVPDLGDISLDRTTNLKEAYAEQTSSYYYEGILLGGEIVWNSALAAARVAH